MVGQYGRSIWVVFFVSCAKIISIDFVKVKYIILFSRWRRSAAIFFCGDVGCAVAVSVIFFELSGLFLQECKE